VRTRFILNNFSGIGLGSQDPRTPTPLATPLKSVYFNGGVHTYSALRVAALVKTQETLFTSAAQQRAKQRMCERSITLRYSEMQSGMETRECKRACVKFFDAGRFLQKASMRRADVRSSVCPSVGPSVPSIDSR